LAVVESQDMVVAMLVDKAQVLSLGAFLQLAAAVLEITIMRVQMVDQVLEALNQVLEATEKRMEQPDKVTMAELTLQEHLVAEVALEV
jgi:hypothetical protein